MATPHSCWDAGSIWLCSGMLRSAYREYKPTARFSCIVQSQGASPQLSKGNNTVRRYGVLDFGCASGRSSR